MYSSLNMISVTSLCGWSGRGMESSQGLYMELSAI